MTRPMIGGHNRGKMAIFGFYVFVIDKNGGVWYNERRSITRRLLRVLPDDNCPYFYLPRERRACNARI